VGREINSSPSGETAPFLRHDRHRKIRATILRKHTRKINPARNLGAVGLPLPASREITHSAIQAANVGKQT